MSLYLVYHKINTWLYYNYNEAMDWNLAYTKKNGKDNYMKKKKDCWSYYTKIINFFSEVMASECEWPLKLWETRHTIKVVIIVLLRLIAIVLCIEWNG